MSAPVLVTSDVRYAGDCGSVIDIRIELSCGDVGYRRALALAVSVAVEAFLEQRDQINEMVRESEVLLGYLELCHHLGVRHVSEKRAEWLAWLEIDRTVLDLYEHIVAELAVERSEFVICLACPVRTLRGVYECPPHHDAVERLECIGKHVCSVCMGAAEVLWARKAF